MFSPHNLYQSFSSLVRKGIIKYKESQLAQKTSTLKLVSFKSQFGHITFVEIDHNTISMGILPFRWFKKDSCQLQSKVCA